MRGIRTLSKADDQGNNNLFVVAAARNLFFDHVRPAQPDEPTCVAAGPPALVVQDDTEVLEAGGTLGEERTQRDGSRPVH